MKGLPVIAAALVVVAFVLAEVATSAFGGAVPAAAVYIAVGALSGQFAMLRSSSTLTLAVAVLCVLAILALGADGLTVPVDLTTLAVGALAGHYTLPPASSQVTGGQSGSTLPDPIASLPPRQG